MDISHNYAEAVKAIKGAILRSQYRAISSVNKEQLSLYYGVGQYVSENSRDGFWGTGAIETISQQLQKELPGLRGFSAANIKFMRQFYESWSGQLKSLTAVSEVDTFQLVGNKDIDGEVFDLSVFLSLGFTHHMIIVRKVQTLTERLFYIRQAVVNKWSKEVLTAKIADDLFHHKGELAHNSNYSGCSTIIEGY